MRRVRRLFRWPWRTAAQVRDDVEAELRFHLDERARDLEREGLSATGAARRARAEFGDVEAARARLGAEGVRFERRARVAAWLGELRQDVRYGWRALRWRPGLTAVVVLTLALGVGANAAIFSVVNAVVLRPLPYTQPERLVAFVDAGSYRGEFLEYQQRARSFARIAAYTDGGEVSLTGQGDPARLEESIVTAELFATLGSPPLLGRTFLPGEDRVGQPPVVVLSHALWQQRFGADPRVIGAPIQLDGVAHTVVGVMSPDFHFPTAGTQLWVPWQLDPADRVELWSMGVGRMIGRLRPGVSVEQAAAELGTLAPQMRELFPWDMPANYGTAATAVPLRERMVGDVRPTLLILLGAVALVLLIACANIANLLLVRASARRKEIAIRAALGAGRWRIARQVLAECLLLAMSGGAVGLALAFAGVRLLVAGLPAGTPRLEEIGIDGRVLGFTLAVTLAAGLLSGVLPALRAAGVGLQAVLKEGGRSGGAGAGAGPTRRRAANALVAAEVALAVVLVSGAGLLIRSFAQLVRVDPGFRTEQLVSATVAPSEAGYPDAASRRAFARELVQRLRALSGVQGVAVANTLPFGGAGYGSVFKIEGRPDPAAAGGDWPLAHVGGVVSADYLRTLGIPLRRGRGFTDADRAGAPSVVIVNESLAREYWPGGDAIGKRIRGPADGEWETIVGVVADVKYDALGEVAGTRALYRPLLQAPVPATLAVIVRTTAGPQAIAAGLRQVVATVDRDTPVDDIRTMAQRVSASVAEPRFTMLLLAAFAAVALALGALGIYGVLAYMVSQRTGEIGLRLALGAHPRDAVRLVVRQGLAVVLLGTVIGLAGALALTRVLGSLLYGVSATDPLTFVAVPVVLTVVALLATALPARRAARVDPARALRVE